MVDHTDEMLRSMAQEEEWKGTEEWEKARAYQKAMNEKGAAGHTPGPWTAAYDDDGGEIFYEWVEGM